MKIAFTIATANFLAQAKTVADSFLIHNPDYTFFIVLLDKNVKIDISFFQNIQLIQIESLNLPYLHEMVDRYSIFELSNCLKPFCADYFLNYRDDIEVVLYFDSDVVVYNKLTEVDDLIKSHSIIITPHVMHPPPFDGLSHGENNFLSGGIYNGGFFGISKSKESEEILAWWKERLRSHGMVDLANGYFVDQLWLNLVPLYFKGVKILKHPGYNIASWNLHERLITIRNDGCFFVNEVIPLVFFHFSGYNLNSPEIISKYQNRFSFQNRPDIIPLFKKYTATLLKNGYDEFSLLNCYYYIEKEAMKSKQKAGITKKLSFLLTKAIFKSKVSLKRIIDSVHQ